MNQELQITPLSKWGEGISKPLIIAGPCSAETEEQLLETSRAIKDIGIDIIRAGIWKPRTRPNSFEGIGSEALQWAKNVKKELNVKFAVEVANPKHVYESLKYGIDILWIGARSSVNPFTVQEIADALKGVDIPVLIKNPINPELALWLGAIERVQKAGVEKIGAIHRGFSTFQKTKYRNIPTWQIPIELKSAMPHIPLICDPSHIAGDRKYVQEVSQRALDLDYDGLIIETHRDPDAAWSDAKQQVTPAQLKEMLASLKFRKSTSEDKEFIDHLEELREHIDRVDHEILEVLAQRMKLSKEIGMYKRDKNVAVFQLERKNEIFKTRVEWGDGMGLTQPFVEELYKLIHDESIRTQTNIMKD